MTLSLLRVLLSWPGAPGCTIDGLSAARGAGWLHAFAPINKRAARRVQFSVVIKVVLAANYLASGRQMPGLTLNFRLWCHSVFAKDKFYFTKRIL